MEMPTPCQHCGEIFDLNDGYVSDKWYKDIVICEECHCKEQDEIENDEYSEEMNIEISNALYDIENKVAFINQENRSQILLIAGLIDKTPN